MKRFIKKIVSTVLACAVMAGMTQGMVFAAGSKIYVDSDAVSEGADGSAGNPYTSIQDAVQNAEEGDTIVLKSDVTLTSKLTIDKDITINGKSYAIKGDTNSTAVYIEITGGTTILKNVSLTEFGNSKKTNGRNAVVMIPDKLDPDTDAKVIADNVTMDKFCRSGFDIRSGSFEIKNSFIDCAATNSDNQTLTKAVLAGMGSNPVTGTIVGTTITNSVSTYEDWSSSAIEVYNNANVSITGGSISNSKYGVWVDNYWGTSGAAVVNISGTKISATADAVLILSQKEREFPAKVTITSGVFKGLISIYDGTANDSIVVTGGKFSEDPSAYLADGYQVTGSAGNYKVSEIPPYIPPYIPPVPDQGDDKDEGTTGPSNPEDMPKDGFGTDSDGDTYFFEDGEMVTGWVEQDETWYYMDEETGIMNTETWLQVDGTWYNFNEDGEMLTGWQKVDGIWYYMKDWGGMATGWQWINGVWYYLYSWGGMATDWVYDNGAWYYMKDWGGMATGWQWVDGNWYYLYANGVMAANTTIDGYVLGADGAMR